MEYLLISACLLGRNTKYNGKNNYRPEAEALKTGYKLIPVCPEVLGGLSIPRKPSEIRQGRVLDSAGHDVSACFERGAEITERLVKKYNIRRAVLKDGSPSCGSKEIYDGSFSGKKVCGQGITAGRLSALGIEIYSETEIYKLLGGN